MKMVLLGLCVHFSQGETELRPVAERTGSQQPKRAGTTARDRPELTEAFVNAVVAS